MPTDRDSDGICIQIHSIDEKKLNDLQDSITEETVKYMVLKLTKILDRLQDESNLTNTDFLKNQHGELEKVTKRLESIVECLKTIREINLEVNPPPYI